MRESRGLESPSFDLGRIYRIRYAKNPRGPQPQLSSASTPELIAHLSHANGWWRDTAQRLLIERNEPESFASLKAALQSNQDDITRIHSLWTLAGLNQLTSEDLAPLLGRRTSTDLQCHALAAALELSEEIRSSLSSAAQKLIGPGKATTPYAIRLIAGLPLTDNEPLLSSLKAAGDTPFIIDAALTGLFSQEVSEFPSSNDRLNYHLTNYNRYLKNKNSGNILTGELLASFERGKALFLGSAACAGCHGADGLGLPNLGPPLDESEWVTGSTSRLTKILLHGLQGPIRVNGKNYKPLAAMPGLGMNPTVSDKDLADIMTYIRSEWSNKASQVTVPQVRKVREETKDRNGRLYTAKELGS